jgi:phthiocerol/phenolphthiocerol synthesis type-I polyketide synthase E
LWGYGILPRPYALKNRSCGLRSRASRSSRIVQSGDSMTNLSTAQMTASDSTATTKLTEIWQELLGIDPIGIDQNYFDLGGDSSLAVHLFARIEKVFNVKLPLATLFEAPTIEELARILSDQTSVSGWSPLVAIQPNGTRPPFFCMHPHGGNVLVYRGLAKELGDDQPFFGLQSQGLDGTRKPLSRIEEMAAIYLREIRKAQPRGPYFLGGYCMGGNVAYEVACQLQQVGEEVALLALFDTLNLSTLPPFSLLQMTYYNSERIAFHLTNLLQLNSTDRSRFVSEKLQGLRIRIPVWLGGVRAKLGRQPDKNDTTSEAQILGKVWDANFRACQDYAPRPYRGTVTDIRPCRQYRIFDQPQFKWDRLADGGQKTIVLPVNPPAILSEPFVSHLAVALRKCLDEAIQATRSSRDHLLL